jgi:hypothetical protein
VNATCVLDVFTSSRVIAVGIPGTVAAMIENSDDCVPTPAAFLA